MFLLRIIIIIIRSRMLRLRILLLLRRLFILRYHPVILRICFPCFFFVFFVSPPSTPLIRHHHRHIISRCIRMRLHRVLLFHRIRIIWRRLLRFRWRIISIRMFPRFPRRRHRRSMFRVCILFFSA